MFPLDNRISLITVEPGLSRLEAGDDWMLRRMEMRGRVFVGRTVAAADVPALRASAKVKPPAVFRRAFDTTSA